MLRFAITHINKDGYRVLTFANQGRNFYNTENAAEKAMALYTPDLRSKILGNAADTLEIRSVDCYDNGDARTIYFSIERKKE